MVSVIFASRACGPTRVAFRLSNATLDCGAIVISLPGRPLLRALTIPCAVSPAGLCAVAHRTGFGAADEVEMKAVPATIAETIRPERATSGLRLIVSLRKGM